MSLLEGCAATSSQRPLEVFKSVGIYHEVQKGETLWGIANVYRIDVNRLVEANKLPDPSKLSAGQLLYIPGKKTK